MTSLGPLSDVIRGELERWIRATIARLLDHLGLCHKSMLGYLCHGSGRLQRVWIADKTALSGWKGGFVVPDS
jgi:hypothetical protein